MPVKENEQALNTVLRHLGAARKHHDNFVAEVDRLYRAYKGQVEIRSEAATWTSKYHPPYVLQMIESMVAAMCDPFPKVRIKPRPKLGEDMQRLLNGAKTLEYASNYALDRTSWNKKQRAWVLQALIARLSITKQYWKTEQRPKKALQYSAQTLQDPFGVPYASIPVLSEAESTHTSYDDPCVEVRDVRDFLWPESATDLESAPWVIDRCWIPKEHIKDFVAEYGVNPDKVDADVWNDAPNTGREDVIKGRNRTLDLAEVLEHWTDDGVITVVNRKLVLRDDPNPFWHGKKPFTVVSSMPEPFMFDGISVVELVADLQEMLWSLQNQRLDSLRLQMNNIMVVRSDLANVDMFEFAPGAWWPVEDISQIKPLEINPQVSNISLQAEALIKGDLQNVPGGAIMASADSQTLDQQTATGVSIISSIAQKLVQHRQAMFRYATGEIVEQVGGLLQQFVREPRLIEIVGPGADPSFLQVSPEEIQGDYDYVAEVNDESMIRQERRAEVQAMLQVLAQVEQNAMLSGVKWNWQALAEDLLDAYDIRDTERYILPAQPQQPQLPPGAPQPQPGAPTAMDQGPGGVTSPQATAPTAPSNQTSVSPEVFMQRLMANRGGVANAPTG